MDLELLSAKKFSGTKLKATIQSTGKLGFSSDTAKALSISRKSYVKFARDKKNKGNLFISFADKNDGDAFKVCSAGAYCYVPTTEMFNALGVDFKSERVIFDLSRDRGLDQTMGGRVYAMNKRSIAKAAKIK